MTAPIPAAALFLVLVVTVAPGSARAQENVTAPPPPLQWPTPASPGAAEFPIGTLRRMVEFGANGELCRQLMKDANQPVPPDFDFGKCPPEFAAKVNAGEGKVSWVSGARPTQCGTSCVGRPFVTRSQSLDRPNTILSMLYGHLDFLIDVPGPFNRDVRYGYEAQFRCVIPPGAHQGDVNVRVVFGTPVVGDPGILESIADFMIPANISRAIETGIAQQLSTPGTQGQSVGQCTSIGAKQDPSPPFDSALFDPPRPGGTRVRPVVTDAAVGRTAMIRFSRITRKPPTFGYAPPADPGQFTVFVNGVPAHVPGTPPLNLPVAGGSAPINFCKTVDMRGADRLQILFVNSLGGAVWSQFAPNVGFGAGPTRTMTTGRTVVVPGQSPPSPTPGKPSGGSKPQQLVLREFELLYTIEYRAPASEVAAPPPAAPGGGTRPTRPGVARVPPLTAVNPGGGQAPQPCRPL